MSLCALHMIAKQCIIVRNHETKAKIRIDFPSALAMTVEECKGLEVCVCVCVRTCVRVCVCVNPKP